MDVTGRASERSDAVRGTRRRGVVWTPIERRHRVGPTAVHVSARKAEPVRPMRTLLAAALGISALACNSSAPTSSSPTAYRAYPHGLLGSQCGTGNTAGAPGVGDAYFPNYGNGGYDVQHYDLDLRYAPGP